ncbi:hypothetical protein NQZ79_g2582 [Umbelopsis isabellina]|nr:hypothetical protein NQZ79_g2582 [Umbelopsis isabellina]
MDLLPDSQTYYENFLEILALLFSKAIATKEQEAILNGLKEFQDRLRRLSSQNLSRLRLELSEKEPNSSSHCKHAGISCTENCTRGFIRAFVVSFGGKYLIGVIPALLTGKLFKRPSILREMAGNTYRGTLCTLRNLRKDDDPKSDRLNAFVAGAIAGLSLLIDPSASRRRSIMLYLLTRSLHFNCSWLMSQWAAHRRRARRDELLKMKEELDLAGFEEGEKRQLVVRKKWDDKLAKYMQRYAGVGIMMLVSAQLLNSMMLDPSTLPKSYYQFMLHHGGWKEPFGPMADPLVRSMANTSNQLMYEKDILIPKGYTSREYVAQHISPNIASIIPSKLKHNAITCALTHPLTDSCSKSAASRFRTQFFRSLKFYVPLNIIIALVFRTSKLQNDPGDVFIRLVKSCLRSSLFLTSYVVVGIASLCMMRNTLHIERPWMYRVHGLLAGTMTLIEAPERQLELGLYCLPRALETWWRAMVKSGYARNLPNGEVMLFMAAMGSLMSIYQVEPDTIAPRYLNVMTRLFGRS